MSDENLAAILKLLRVVIGQFQDHNEIMAKINNLPPPRKLPEDWDKLQKLSPTEVPSDGS